MSRRSSALLALAVAACSPGRDQWIADLQASRPEARALAVKKLAENFNEDDLGLFTQAARDPVPVVRAEAMAALGKSPDPRVVDLLGEGLGDDDEDVQARAAAALASLRTEKARAYLTLQFSRRSRNTRMAIVQALKSTNVPGAMASVVAAEASAIWDRNLKALQGGALPERVGAAEEVGRSGRPEAVNRLVPLLKDNQVVLAAAAARGLGDAADVRAVPGLTALLEENFPELREAACEALARLKDPAALPNLLAVAQDKSPASPLATAAIVALPQSADTDKALCDLVLLGPGPEASAAGREMRRRGCPVEPILKRLDNGAPNAALAAIVALAPQAKEVAPKVAGLLTSADATTRKLAVDALAEVGDATAGAAVLKAWEAELKALEPLRAKWIPAELPLTYGRGFDPDAPLPADDPAAMVHLRTTDLFRKVKVLDEQRAREAGKVLLTARPPRELVDDANEDQLKVLASLVRALGRLKLEGAREKVTPFTRESSPSLRAAAYAALASLGGDALKDARAGLLDDERSVQAATAQALAEAGAPGRAMILEVGGQLAGDRTRLLEPLRGGPVPRAGVAALIALAREGGLESGLAATLLGEAKAAEAVEPLLKLLDDPKTVARRDVLVALGRLGDARAADAVGKDLYSDSADVRAAAAEALAQLGGGSHLEALDALKGDYYLRVRDAANAALAHLGPEGKR